jgi:hypothetical protein
VIESHESECSCARRSKGGWVKGHVVRMLLFFTVSSVAWAQSTAQGPLRVSTINPRYFTTASDRTGKAVYMVGSHNWQVLQDRSDQPPFDYSGYLAFLRARGHNFFRMWYYDTPRAYVVHTPYFNLSPVPFKRTGGGQIYDLGQRYKMDDYNEDYFTRLYDRCRQAQEAGIYVAVMLSGAWWPYELPDLGPDGRSAWQYGYWNPVNSTYGNNQQYTAGQFQIYTMQAPVPSPTPSCTSTPHPSPPSCPPHDPIWINLMDKFIEKVVKKVNDLDNIVFEVTNEGPKNSFEWQRHVIDYVRQVEANIPNGKQHLIGFTPGHGDTGHGPCSTTTVSDNATYLDSCADWVSLSAIPSDPGHGVPDYPTGSPIKPDMLDTDHIWGVGFGSYVPTVDYLWRGFTRGHNHWYMEAYGQFSEHPPLEDIRNVMGYIKMVADSCDLIHMLPDTTTTSTRYALVNPGLEYLVYHSNDESPPTPATVTIHNMPAKKFNYEWVSPTSGVGMGSGSITTIPGDNNFPPPAPTPPTSVLHLRAALELKSAVSRKTHNGTAFDIALPAVESRGGPNHLLVFTFSNPVVSGNASVTEGTGTVSGSPVFAGKTITVNLTGVTNRQYITVTLNNVTDSLGQRLAPTSVRAGMLHGDTNGNGIVNATDVSETKFHSGTIAHAGNFRNDIIVTGHINGTDVSQVKLNVGHGLP